MPPRQNDTRSSASQQRQRPSEKGGQNKNGQPTGNPRGNQQGKSSRAGASQTTPRRVQPAASGPIPLWAWIILILIIGVLLGKHFLTSSHPEKPQGGNASIMTRSTTDNTSPDTSTDQKGGKGQASGDSTTKMPSFEFYTLLPESEVIAPDIPSTQSDSGATTETSGSGASSNAGSNNSTANSASNQTAAASNQAVASANNRPTAKPATAPRQTASTSSSSNTTSTSSNTHAGSTNSNASSSFGGVSYMLQAASFKSQSDANTMASNFRQMGLTMQVTQVQTSDGTTWYRVQAGPFTDSNALTHARSVMQRKGIDALTIRQR